jgi:lipopolysaccharide export system permease protein
MILWRHILRAHIGPFIFANAVIIFLFLLQFLMKRAGDLVGKGLSVWVIFELIGLNLAWILVLSVPMAVLVATLMAFGKLSADNEVTVMRTSGMSLYRMMFSRHACRDWRVMIGLDLVQQQCVARCQCQRCRR